MASTELPPKTLRINPRIDNIWLRCGFNCRNPGFDDKKKSAQVLENYTVESNGKEKIVEFCHKYFLGDLKRILVIQSARELESPIDTVDGSLKYINFETFQEYECYNEYEF